MNAFTIKDLEHLSGIKAHTIRIWEQRYSFLKPQRTDTNIRYYTNDELKTILKVALLNKYGFKISQIDKMSEEDLNQKLQQLNDIEAQQEKLVMHLVQCMVDLDYWGFEACINQQIQKKGIEKTFTQLLIQFLEKIGILWQTNKVNPSQEHLVTNLIRQKLMVGIDQCPPPQDSTKSAVLFLPENEYHELGLLFVYYLMKINGINVIYLGNSVPVADVIYMVQHKKTDLLYTHLTCQPGRIKVDKYLQQLKMQCPKIPIYISGAALPNLSSAALQHTHPIYDIKGLHHQIQTLALAIPSYSAS